MGYERITDDSQFDSVRESHEWRYRWASKFVMPEDLVLDCACGTGYGARILGGAHYNGVDRFDNGTNIVADLETWQPDFPYDVFISIETIEHLTDAGVQNLLNMAKNARKYAVISTPIIPTKHRNEFHTQDFTLEQVKSFLPNLIEFSTQDSGDGTVHDMYGIAVFKNG